MLTVRSRPIIIPNWEGISLLVLKTAFHGPRASSGRRGGRLMIRVTCPGCQARLNAKDELAGQMRKCPKCGTEIRIPEPEPGFGPPVAEAEPVADEWAGLDEVAPGQHVQLAADEPLPKFDGPTRLTRANRYLICGRSNLIGMWEGNGQGWMLKTNAGYVKVKHDPGQLPSQGHFTLVELLMSVTDEGTRLRGLRCYELAERWALNTLEQDEHKVLSRVVGPGRLLKEQKAVVQRFLREQFMRSVWEEAKPVLDYLNNTDYHSPGVE